MTATFAREHARRWDPETSQNAAQSMILGSFAHSAEIVLALETAGHALAAHEIAGRCELSAHQISRRLVDLRRAGVINDSGERATTPAGRASVRWELTDAE